MKLGFVVPRYGADVVGGAETLARSFAEHLAADRYDVDVLTTCARDHHTWENVLPPGEERCGDVRVLRFPVAPRDVNRFFAVQERISAQLPIPLDEELEWAAGSVNSEELYEWLAEHGREYDALLFLPYLFGTTLLGSRVDPQRSLLIPCLHDEPFAATRVVRHLFQSVRGLLFNSVPERRLAARLFAVGASSPVVGMGFDSPSAPADAPAFRARYGLDGDYLLYFGRKEDGKNVSLLLDGFAACRTPGLRLVVAGDGVLDRSRMPPGVVDLPRLEEDEKRAACAGAVAVCQPSTNESFSIVLMEAWLQATPVLVNARCEVTRHHVRRSGGGLYFDGRRELAAEVDWLSRNPEEARRLGEAGRAFVLEEYGWPTVLERFERGLASILGGNA